MDERDWKQSSGSILLLGLILVVILWAFWLCGP